MKKYELTDDFIEIGSQKIKLYRIKSLIDISSIGVKAGDLGGYIEKEDNLDQIGDAWVSGDAQVFGNAWVFGDAWVFGNARVSGDALISDRKSIIWFSMVGRENGILTVYKSKAGELLATRGCFSGAVDEFLSKSAKVHDEKTQREYQLLIEVAKSRLS